MLGTDGRFCIITYDSSLITTSFFPLFSLTVFSQASTQMIPRGIYSDVTLPYLFSFLSLAAAVELVVTSSIYALHASPAACAAPSSGSWLAR